MLIFSFLRFFIEVCVSMLLLSLLQVEFHPHWQQTKELHLICRQHRILLQAYSSLGGTANNSLLKDSTVADIAARNSISAAQVLLRWALQRHYGGLPQLHASFYPIDICKYSIIERYNRMVGWE